MKTSITLFLTALLVFSATAAETKLKLENLPAAVQSGIKEQTGGATVVGISKEKEKGKTLYEVETKVNGKTRDLMIDSKGALLSSEDEVDLDSIPAAAKAAIQKHAGSATIVKVEKVTVGSAVSYEASLKSKSGKSSEVGVNADGTPHKE